MKKVILVLVSMILIQYSANATHSIGGEITAKYVNGLTYKLTFTYYTRISSPADRPTIQFNISDSLTGYYVSDSAVAYSSTVHVAPDIRKRIYDTLFTFPAIGDYIISVEDPNRTYSIYNIPGSVNVPFYNKCLIHVDMNNSSPVFLNDPIFYAQQGVPFTCNPLPYDENDDSLRWIIDTPLGAGGASIVGYTLPSSDFKIDSVTGQISFIPQTIGVFSYVVKVNEYRNNVLIGYIRRDMLIFVIASNNNPFTSTHNSNIAQSPDRYYRIPYNHTFNFNYSITDPDPVLISNGGNGEPLIANNPATFNHTDGNSNAQASLNWITTATNYRIHPYLFAFRTLDISANDSFYLDYSLALKVEDFSYGINEISTTNVINISPNPFSTQTNLTLQGTYHSPTLFIYNLMGQEVRSIPVGTNTRLTINRERLPSGMYFYKLIEEDKEVLGIGKLIIQF